MRLSEICIQRPVLAWVLTLILVLLGIVGGTRLPVQQYPKYERPYITIETSLPGAGPEVVEAQITNVIEEAMAGLEGVASVTSSSGVEDSKVSLEFVSGLKKDPAVAIINRLNKISDKIPDEARASTLTEARSEEKAILVLALTSEQLPASELADYAFRELQKEIESLTGVARVDVLGGGQYTMHIFVDPLKMSAHNITVAEIKQALKRQNIEKPAGKLISNDREYLVTTIATMSEPEEFNNMIIASKENHLIHLRDIGYAEITSEDHRTRTRFNGKVGVSLSIIKQSTANPIDVARAVKKMIANVKERLPDGMELNIATDRTTFIERSIKEVYRTIVEAAILVILVVLAFLRSAKASLIPIVTIPVSLIGSFFVMYVMDFSINIFTLMALVLAIGLVVDDAIIVLENIYRHIENGVKPLSATIRGIREINFAVIATTLTLVSVYIPIALSTGMTGKLFTEFAITLACAVLISGFAALTLSPMMCARILRGHGAPNTAPNRFSAPWEKIKSYIRTDLLLEWAEPRYEELVRKTLEHKWITVASGGGFALIGLLFYISLPQEFTPREDHGYISIEGQAPPSSTIGYTDRYVQKIDTVLDSIEEIERRVTQITNPTYEMGIQLKNARNRSRSTDNIVADLNQKLADITGVEARVRSSSSGLSEEKAIDFVIMGNKNHQELKELSNQMTYELYTSGLSTSVRAEVRSSDAEDFTLTVNRNKVSSLGIEAAAIAETVDALIRGQKATSFKKDNKLYDVKVEVEDRFRRSPHDITNLFIQANDKEKTLVSLAELVNVQSRAGPIEVRHYNRVRSIGYKIELASSYSLDTGIAKVKSLAKEILPKDVRVEFTGETKRFLEESSNVRLIFFLALAFIYLVMAAQFESWIDPFIIILTVPLSLAGAILVLRFIDNGSINLYSQIGLVTLIGLITKHGIMMVDFANRLRDQGKTIYEAITEASKLRLRPILMTTFAMVLGTVPLALASGAGSESRRQIGWVIVGGMSIGTVFTLFVLPTVYMLLTRRKRAEVLSSAL